jgi:hypothetical protein
MPATALISISVLPKGDRDMSFAAALPYQAQLLVYLDPVEILF